MNQRDRMTPNLAIAAVVLLCLNASYAGSYIATIHWTSVSFAVAEANERPALRLAAALYRPAYEVDRKFRPQYWLSRNIDDRVRSRIHSPATLQEVVGRAGGGLQVSNELIWLKLIDQANEELERHCE